MRELRVTEVNISQVRACNALQLGALEHMSFSATNSFAIYCQNVLRVNVLQAAGKKHRSQVTVLQMQNVS